MALYNVKWYSGMVLNERPASIVMDGEEIPISRIVWREIREDNITRERKRIFIVETAKGNFKISYNFTNEAVEVEPIE
ncbi:MAG: hypothetical protein Q7J55_04515 [bacterium]|nr:hypothetical protein [bacterium]